MTTYTVFYDPDTKEIINVANGVADDELSTLQAEAGWSRLVVETDDTPSGRHYVNDAEDNIVSKSSFNITTDVDTVNLDEVVTFSNVPEGTDIVIQGEVTATMDNSGSLTMTAKEAGTWRITFDKDKYFQQVILIQVRNLAI